MTGYEIGLKGGDARRRGRSAGEKCIETESRAGAKAQGLVVIEATSKLLFVTRALPLSGKKVVWMATAEGARLSGRRMKAFLGTSRGVSACLMEAGSADKPRVIRPGT